jgi:predicted permease
MGGSWSLDIETVDHPTCRGSDAGAQIRRISPSYFSTMRVPILEGQAFRPSDRAGSEPVAIINQTLARRCFQQGSPIGAHIYIGDGKPNPRTIVGVVRDEKVFGLTNEVPSLVYMPYAQGQWGSGTTFTFLIQTASAPLALARPAQAAIRELEPELAFADVREMDWSVANSVLPERMASFLVTSFALAALVLAALGIHAVIANMVSNRRREIGIRMALGAGGADILRFITWGGLRLTIAGLSIGLAASTLLTRHLKSLLHAISPTDPWTFAPVTLFLACVALVACWVPARRATNVDPATELRRGE